ncbi:MAG: hypothetical protein RLN62_02510 [Rickettsiales bacterium]
MKYFIVGNETIIENSHFGPHHSFYLKISIGSLSSEHLAVVWNSDSGIYTKTISDFGQTMSSTALINPTKSGYYPKISSSQNGEFCIVWRSNDLDGSGVWGQTFKQGGDFSTHFRANTHFQDDQEDSDVSYLPNGNFVVVWMSYYQDGDDGGVYGQIFDQSANKISSEFLVNTNTKGIQYRPAVTSLPNSKFVVSWQSDPLDGNPTNIYGQVFSEGGIKIGSEFKASNVSNTNEQESTITFLTDNKFVLVWQTYGRGEFADIYGQVFDQVGNKIGNEFLVNSDIKGSQSLPSISTLMNDNFVVVWLDNVGGNEYYSIKGQVFDQVANKLGGAFEVKNYHGRFLYSPYAVVSAIGANDFAVVWGVKEVDQITNDRYSSLNIQFYGACDNLQKVTDQIDVFDFSVLSFKVYDNPEDIHISLPDGWKEVIDTRDDGVLEIEANGYFGRLYVNGETAVVSNRGAESFDWKDLAADFALYKGEVSKQFTPAKAFYEYSINYLCEHNPEVKYVAFTGHSLGAALAEMLSAKYQYPAVTFESPGVKKILKNNPDEFTAEDIIYADDNVVTYNAAPNLVNTMSEHVGEVKRAYPEVDSITFNEIDLLAYGKSKDVLPKPIKLLKLVGSLFYQVIKISAEEVLEDVSNYLSYTFYSQHLIKNMISEFNLETSNLKVEGEYKSWPNGILEGFAHYRLYDNNPYYWNNVLKSLSIGEYTKKWLINEVISKVADLTKEGVVIRGDDSGNKIWGTTNFDDTISSGIGDDIIYLHYGNDQVEDGGGFDKYIIPADIGGRKEIIDNDVRGIINLYDGNLVGDAIPVIHSLCPTVTVNKTYFLHLGEVGSYYITKVGNSAEITNECADSQPELSNLVTIAPFTWSNYGIDKYEGSNKIVLVGSNEDDYLDCSEWNPLNLFRDCFIDTLKGNDLAVVTIGNNNVRVIGNDAGIKTIKLIKEELGYRRLSESGSGSIDIVGIKEGDVLDLTEIQDEIDGIGSQNGSHLTIALRSGYQLTAQITLGNQFVSFNIEDGNITTTGQNMTEMLENIQVEISNATIVHLHAPSPTPSPSATASPSPSISASVIPSSLSEAESNDQTFIDEYGIYLYAGVGVLGAIMFMGCGYMAFRSYCTHKTSNDITDAIPAGATDHHDAEIA